MTTFIAKGAWKDSRGARHNFEIESDRAERRFIKELVTAQYPCVEKDVIILSVRRPKCEHIANFEGYEGQAITNSESTPVTSGNIGMDSVRNATSNVIGSDNSGIQLFGLLALIAAGYVVWFSAPVIAFCGAGGLAFKATKNTTRDLQWYKRCGIMLITTGFASMLSYHGTIEAQESLVTWWDSIETTEEVSYQ